MMSLFNELRNAYKNGGYLTRLIYINVIIFFLIRGIDVILFLMGLPMGTILNYLALPNDLGLLLYRPWTLVTYMFVHYSFFHILSNLLFLYWFGRIFLQYLNQKKLLSTYIIGGICGGLLYLIAFNSLGVFSQSNSILLGASAAVFAIVVATAVYAPNYQLYLMFIGPVRIKYIALFYIALSTILITSNNAGGNIAHLGGALWGYLFIHFLKKGKDIGSWIYPILDKIIHIFSSSSKNMKVKYRRSASDMDDQQYNINKKSKEKETNRILDKIAKSGYDSLTQEEKNHLFKMGKK
ncbi:rhomboid family intramembrane serine protease [Halosquirtibacter xylanolyticus]|uniref:rhomboid family protein n=1 Tax=Halosquirtibacter xylanolyticus TaxID=3374599 RepID=UPI003747FB45|nr:rhomboid family intramembrane serine protease [Prolixibacteraceae bacterium]